MGFAIGITLAVIVALLVAGGGSSSGAGYPDAIATTVALCRELAARGEVPPLAASNAATNDLAINAIVRLGVLGSWPPPADASKAQHDYWAMTRELARAVRAGDLVCDDAIGPDGADGDGDELDDATQREAEGRRLVCVIVGAMLDPRDAYLEAGVLPDDQPRTLAANAWAGAGGNGSPPASLVDFAASVLAMPDTCPMPEMFITLDSPRGPGGFVQLEKDVAGRTDELDDLASLADLYPGAKGATAAVRLDLMRRINDHPWNRGLHVDATQAFTKATIGDRVISFLPRWRADPKTSTQRFEPGSSYAVAYLPAVTFGG